MSKSELGRELAAVGRPMTLDVLTKVEKGQRRLDADDLVALALVLDVTPSRLMFGPSGDRETELRLVGDVKAPADVTWKWARGERPLGSGRASFTDHLRYGRLRQFRRENQPDREPERSLRELRQLRETHGPQLKAVTDAVGAAVESGLSLDAIRQYIDVAALSWDPAGDEGPEAETIGTDGR